MRNYNDTPRAAARSWPSPHHHHHQVRVAGEGRRVVAPPCPRSTARRQRSPVGRVGSFRSWSSHLFRGRPGTGTLKVQDKPVNDGHDSGGRSRGVVGRDAGGTASPHFFRQGDASPTPPLFGLKFVQKLVHCCNWLLTETQCKIISVQHVCRPKLS